MANAVAALEIDALSHAFGGRKALDDVSISVGAGRFCCLLGLNGAGKTTLFSLVSRFYDNISGSICVYGHDVRRQPIQALQNLGMVFQNRSLDLDLTVMQNLVYSGALHGMAKSEARDRATTELERSSMADRADDKVRSLSGGQMRRVEIARALLHSPRLLLLDEPTSNLDIKARQDLVTHIRNLVETDGISVLWATHLIDEVDGSDDIVLLNQGQVVAQGSASQIVAQSGGKDLREAFDLMTGESGGVLV